MPLETVPGTALRYYLIAFDAAGRERDEPGGHLEPAARERPFQRAGHRRVPLQPRLAGRCSGRARAIPPLDRRHGGQPGRHRAPAAGAAGLSPLLVGLHWPSLPWGDEALDAGPVSFGPAAGALADEWIDRYAERIADTPQARQALETIFMAAQVDLAPVQLPDDVREAYETLNREAALGSGGAGAEPGADREGFDPESLFQAAGEEPVSFGITDRLFAPLLAPLRTLSFWKMKERARRFGESGGFKLLNELQQAADDSVRFHLMGHSFGCIAASAILAGPESRGVLHRPIHSLALIQGALSLWSFCADIPAAPGRAGYFHPLVAEGKVAGPIITTQSESRFCGRQVLSPGRRSPPANQFCPRRIAQIWSAGRVRGLRAGFRCRRSENAGSRRGLPVRSRQNLQPGRQRVHPRRGAWWLVRRP